MNIFGLIEFVENAVPQRDPVSDASVTDRAFDLELTLRIADEPAALTTWITAD